MIYDCFIFGHEIEILKMRLAELDSVVDKFVLCESPTSFTGNPKPLYYQRNKRFFARYLDRIEHMVVDMPDLSHLEIQTFPRMNHQRNAMIQKLASQCQDDDTIIISDVDEIPKAEVIKNYRTKDGVVALSQRGFSYFLNLEDTPWSLARICPFSTLRTKSMSTLRHDGAKMIKDAGWHFSRAGGPKLHKIKMESCCHTEMNIPEVADPERPRKLVNGGILKVASINGTFPEYVVRHQKRLTKQGFIFVP